MAKLPDMQVTLTTESTTRPLPAPSAVNLEAALAREIVARHRLEERHAADCRSRDAWTDRALNAEERSAGYMRRIKDLEDAEASRLMEEAARKLARNGARKAKRKR